MTRIRAALLGAWAGVIWSLAALTLLGAALRALKVSHPYGIFGLLMPTAGDRGRWMAYCLSAAVAGSLVGLLARRVRWRRPLRRAVLWAAFFPAVGLSTGVVLVAEGLANSGIVGPWWTVAYVPVTMALTGVVASLIVLALPLVVGPMLLLAALTLEAWVRPEGEASTPLRPRIVLTSLLALVTLGSLGYLKVTWTPVEGATWFLP